MEMMEVGLEDDVFFADLNKQISLLIMEEEEEEEDPVFKSPSVSLQNFPRHPLQHPMVPSQIVYRYQEQQQEEIISCRRETKGTGVFIPLLSQPRRNRSKQGRNASSYSTKSNYSKQIVSARGLSPRHGGRQHQHHHHRYHHQEAAFTPTSLDGPNPNRYYY